jgi:membrane protein
VLWRLTAKFIVYFFANLSMVNVLYGSLATVVVVLLLLEIVFVILLLGAGSRARSWRCRSPPPRRS